MKILSTIFYTLFIALVVGIAGLLLGTMLPIPGNIEIKIVKSGSMEPAISTGSLVVVKPAPMYRKGDVVTFGEDTKSVIPTTHRIIEVMPDGSFVTKGDANEEADPQAVTRREVIGKVLMSVPGAGFVLDFARTRLGFALLIGIPAGLVILEEILTITRETQKWYRGRRGRPARRNPAGGRDGDNSAEDVVDLRTHLKRVYAKRHSMDEIKVAMYVEPRWYEAKWWRRRLGLDTDAYHTSTSLTVGLVFFAMMFAGHSGGTISYFQDIETSIGNILAAGEWSPPAPIAPPEDEITSLAAFSVEDAPPEGEVLGVSDETPDADGETLPDDAAPPTEDAEPPEAPDEDLGDSEPLPGATPPQADADAATPPEEDTPPAEAPAEASPVEQEEPPADPAPEAE